MMSTLLFVLTLSAQQDAVDANLRKVQSKIWTWDESRSEGGWNRIYITFDKYNGRRKLASGVDGGECGPVWLISCIDNKDEVIVHSSKGTYWLSKLPGNGSFSVICTFDENLFFDSTEPAKGWVRRPSIAPERFSVMFICKLVDDGTKLRTIAHEAYEEYADGRSGPDLELVHYWETPKEKREVITLVSNKRKHPWLEKYAPKGFKMRE